MAILSFVVSDSQKSVFTASGINAGGLDYPLCPFNVGDIISFPDAPLLFYRVLYRHLTPQKPPMESTWMMALEPCQNPIEEPALR